MPDVSFTTTGISFMPPGLISGTIADWLASSAFPLNSLVDSAPLSPLSPTIWEFFGNTQVTGTPGSPQSFTIQHDDGVTFVVNGQTVVDAPGPTPPSVTARSYTGGVRLAGPFPLRFPQGARGDAAVSPTE